MENRLMHDFDKAYWEDHWQQSDPQTMIGGGPNPYLVQVATALEPGAALDAGCGTGAAAIWLAAQGWQVSGVDISASALRLAAHRAEHTSVSDRIDWIEADITRWAPDSAEGFDLVTTSYAHPDSADGVLHDAVIQMRRRPA
jgi:2-polyprenyl-3-methyl-5-hydroxy-6-metoxy-1,4-benzoquinol methylase